MPRNEAGVYSVPRDWVADEAAVIPLTAARLNEQHGDIQTELRTLKSSLDALNVEDAAELAAAIAALKGGVSASYDTLAEIATKLGLLDTTIAALQAADSETAADLAEEIVRALAAESALDVRLDAAEATITSLGTNKVNTSTLGANSGTATLDSGGKLPASQIPTDLAGALIPKGNWNAATNSPALVTSVGTKGYAYVVTTAGTTSLNGLATWNVGDTVWFDGAVWRKFAGPTAGTGSGASGVATAFDGRVRLHGTVNGFGGSKYLVAVTEDERLLIWGDSASLGFSSSDRYAAYQVPLPWDRATITIEAVYCGLSYILVQTDEATNNLYHLGSSFFGQGGDGSTNSNIVLTRCSLSGVKIVDVTTEASHGEIASFWFGLTSTGRIYSCGYSGVTHTMGYNNTDNLSTPRLMTYSDGTTPITNVAKVYASGFSVPVWARLTTGAAVRWGAGTNGAHGNNSTTAMAWPDALETSHGSGTDRADIASIAVTGGATYANTWLLTTGGKIEVAGQRQWGNGDGATLATAAVTTFQPAAGAIDALTVTKIVAGGGDTGLALAITSAGNAYLAGYTNDGLIGAGGTTSTNTFTILSGLPSGFAGALTNAAVGGGSVNGIYTNITLYLEATVSGAKLLASIGDDATYQSGKGTTGVAAADMTWGRVLGGRGGIASWYTFGTASAQYGLGVLDGDGQLWYAGGNDSGQSGTGQPLAASVNTLQPVQTGVPILLKPPTLRGAYSDVTSYSYNDEATQQGATWRYIAVDASTGNDPPTLPTESNSYWRLTGSKGDRGIGYGGTSTTSLSISTGSKAFTLDSADYAWQVGARIRAASAADTAKWMEGIVASFVSSVLTVTVDLTNGSGTVADWRISAAGDPGNALSAAANATAAAGSATAAAGSATAASGSATTAAGAVTAAAGSATTAATHASTASAAAVTAAAVVGSTMFATKAAADAGLAGVTANAFITVAVDETLGGQITLYQKVSGAYVFQRALSDLSLDGLAQLSGIGFSRLHHSLTNLVHHDAEGWGRRGVSSIMYLPASLTIAQSGTTVTCSGTNAGVFYFQKDQIGCLIEWATGETAVITAISTAGTTTTATVDRSQTISASAATLKRKPFVVVGFGDSIGTPPFHQWHRSLLRTIGFGGCVFSPYNVQTSDGLEYQKVTLASGAAESQTDVDHATLPWSRCWSLPSGGTIVYELLNTYNGSNEVLYRVGLKPRDMKFDTFRLVWLRGTGTLAVERRYRGTVAWTSVESGIDASAGSTTYVMRSYKHAIDSEWEYRVSSSSGTVKIVLAAFWNLVTPGAVIWPLWRGSAGDNRDVERFGQIGASNLTELCQHMFWPDMRTISSYDAVTGETDLSDYLPGIAADRTMWVTASPRMDHVWCGVWGLASNENLNTVREQAIRITALANSDPYVSPRPLFGDYTTKGDASGWIGDGVHTSKTGEGVFAALMNRTLGLFDHPGLPSSRDVRALSGDFVSLSADGRDVNGQIAGLRGNFKRGGRGLKWNYDHGGYLLADTALPAAIGTGDFTLTIDLDVGNQSSRHLFVVNSDNTNPFGIAGSIQIQQASDRLYMQLRDGSGTVYSYEPIGFTTNYQGRRVLTIRSDRANARMEVLIDGLPARALSPTVTGSGATLATWSGTGQHVWIPQSAADANANYIYACAFWRSRLSDAELLANLYADGPTTTTPDFWWDFSEGAGIQVLDRTGNGKHAYLYISRAMPTWKVPRTEGLARPHKTTALLVTTYIGPGQDIIAGGTGGTFTLIASPKVGDVFRLTRDTASSVVLACNTGQTIVTGAGVTVGTDATTAGTGTVTLAQKHSSVTVECVESDPTTPAYKLSVIASAGTLTFA